MTLHRNHWSNQGQSVAPGDAGNQMTSNGSDWTAVPLLKTVMAFTNGADQVITAGHFDYVAGVDCVITVTESTVVRCSFVAAVGCAAGVNQIVAGLFDGTTEVWRTVWVKRSDTELIELVVPTTIAAGEHTIRWKLYSVGGDMTVYNTGIGSATGGSTASVGR